MGDLVDIGAARASRQKRELQAALTPASDPRMYLFGVGGITFPSPCSGFVHNFVQRARSVQLRRALLGRQVVSLTPKPRS